jgi:hypothetical protein
MYVLKVLKMLTLRIEVGVNSLGLKKGQNKKFPFNAETVLIF